MSARAESRPARLRRVWARAEARARRRLDALGPVPGWQELIVAGDPRWPLSHEAAQLSSRLASRLLELEEELRRWKYQPLQWHEPGGRWVDARAIEARHLAPSPEAGYGLYLLVAGDGWEQWVADPADLRTPPAGLEAQWEHGVW